MKQEQIGVMMKILTPRNFFLSLKQREEGFTTPTNTPPWPLPPPNPLRSHVMSTIKAS
ncbi:hypothetical protein Leryth_005231, partial [Lithospermum erythrorhizon]